MNLKAQAKHLELSFSLSPDLPQCIWADEGKLRQILLNLLVNAIKFTSHGAVKLEVSSRLLEPETLRYQLCFTVSDTGPGIAPNEVEELFSPFSQARLGTLSQQGTGLGLSISQRFVQLMGGEIRVCSEMGRGSQFRFAIEVTAVETQSMVDLSYPNPIGLIPSPVSYRILVVDDRFESRILMEQRLTDLGFDVKEAVSGEEAVQLQKSWLPHLVWMDILLPGISGLEATRQIKKHPDPPVVIALTANAFKEDRDEALAAGCDDFVAKPCSNQAIWQMLHDHLHLEYRYASTSDTEPIPLPGQDKLSRQAGIQQLQQMPLSVREALKQAARSLSEPRIAQVMEQIPQQKAELHFLVQQLVENFQYDQLLDIIDRCESSTHQKNPL